MSAARLTTSTYHPNTSLMVPLWFRYDSAMIPLAMIPIYGRSAAPRVPPIREEDKRSTNNNTNDINR